MNWKENAIRDLQDYSKRLTALENLKERHAALQAEILGLKAVRTEEEPVHGGLSDAGDRLLNKITERDRLRWTYEATQGLVTTVERALQGLTKEQQLILTRWYVQGGPHAVPDLCSRLGYEKAHIYRLRDRALREFTVRLYGIEDY